jgi:parallel beta-helix repeat protein
MMVSVDAAWAATLNVSPSGADVGNCVPGPCATINYALSQANPGDTIAIGAGTYAESVSLGVSVNLVGAGIGQTIISGGGVNPGTGSGEIVQYPPNPPAPALNVGLFLGASNVTISDLTIRNFGTHGIQGLAPQSNVTVTRVDASYNGWASNTGRGMFFGSEGTVATDWTNLTVSDSIARQNRLTGIDVNSGTNTGVTLSGNTSADNGDAGLTLAGGTNGLVTNNTVTNNGRFGIEIRNPSASVTVSNNTVRASNDDTLAVPDRWPAATAQLGWDVGGIVVYLRGGGEGQSTVPTGVTITGNSIAGYLRATNGPPGLGQGVGILLEGTGHALSGNSLFHNDVGIQLQSGQVSNATGTDGFDRGSGATPVDAAITGNAICANRLAGVRLVGASAVSPYPLGSNWWGTTAGPNGGASRATTWAASGQIGPDNIAGSITAAAPLTSTVGSIPSSSNCRLNGQLSLSLSGVAGAATITVTCGSLPPVVQNVISQANPVVVFPSLPAGTQCTVTAQAANGLQVGGPLTIEVADNAVTEGTYVLSLPPPPATPTTVVAPPVTGLPTSSTTSNGSGAGLPETGSAPVGLLVLASGLIVIGVAIRRRVSSFQRH